MNEERRLGPEEGWLTLGLVVLMALVLAWAIDDPAWVNGKPELTDSLALCAVLGVASGFVGAKVGWGRWTTHLVGAAFAGLVVPVLAGWAILPGSSIPAAFHATAEGTVQAYLDIAWRDLPFTTREVHYVLTLGAIVWGTAHFSAYAVFGHRHPLNAVVVTGLVLLANMALTLRDQLPYLVLFTGAALFLLIEVHAFDARSTWIRRRIGDPGTISSLYLRGGTVFIVAALLGSLVLTQRAASSPLAGAWDGVNDQLIGIGESLGRLFPVGGDLRGVNGVTFGSTARISGRWFSNDNVAFRATVPADADPNLYWRAATYDAFVLSGWEQTDVTSLPVDAGDPLLVGTAENPVPSLTKPIQVTIRPDSFGDHALLSPGTPIAVNQPSSVLVTGQAGWFDGVDLGSGGNEYTVDARVLRLDDEDVISGNRLRAASEDYPDEITARYTAVPDGALGPDATALLDTILAKSPSRDPYDLAVTLVTYLRDANNFTYLTDIRDFPCTDPSAVECFARYKHGYCLHYASTMAILLRDANPDNRIPTRLVQGFLPGARSGTVETVTNRQAHAWVEVYFPGYGWIPFDPTGGQQGRPSPIKVGPPVASAAPTPSASDDGRPDPTRRIVGNAGDAGPAGPSAVNRPADRTMLIVLAVLLALLVAGVAVAAWLRGPRGEISPESAWRTMSRAASRLGFAPRPTQTVYEYATSLAELVPVAGADLRTVADAKVETEYARLRLGGERLRAVRDASRRLRVSLLRLVFRRRGRRR